MLIVALILAVIGLAALVTAVVTSNELIAWVCIGASGLGVVLLIADAIRDRSRRRDEALPAVLASASTEVIEPVEITEVIEPVETTEVIEPVETTEVIEDENAAAAEEFIEGEGWDEGEAVEDHPEELVHDDPDFDTFSDDEPEFPEPAEEAALHIVSEEDLAGEAEVVDALGDAVESGDLDEDIVVDKSALEVHYAPSAEDSAATVVYTYSESAEIEHAHNEDTEAGDEQRDQ